jgi:hypothetical protein
MSKKQKKVTLLWGLPGSGKSTYAGEFDNRSYGRRAESRRIDIDNLSKNQSGDNLIRTIANEALHNLHYHNGVMLDGLVTTNAVAEKIFSAIKFHPESSNFEIHFEIVWWSKSVEDCLHNDRGRRKLNSRTSIENIPFEEPSEELLEKFNISEKRCIRKRVVRKPEHKAWAGENDLGDADKLYSDSWSLGGTWGNCWGDTGTVSPGAPLTSFQEFDDLLERICPTINFLTYKKLYNATVSIEDYSEGDYYGGSVTYAKFVCDLKKLHEMLSEMQLI